MSARVNEQTADCSRPQYRLAAVQLSTSWAGLRPPHRLADSQSRALCAGPKCTAAPAPQSMNKQQQQQQHFSSKVNLIINLKHTHTPQSAIGHCHANENAPKLKLAIDMSVIGGAQ